MVSILITIYITFTNVRALARGEAPTAARAN